MPQEVIIVARGEEAVEIHIRARQPADARLLLKDADAVIDSLKLIDSMVHLRDGDCD
jgi:hypothetical protein